MFANHTSSIEYDNGVTTEIDSFDQITNINRVSKIKWICSQDITLYDLPDSLPNLRSFDIITYNVNPLDGFPQNLPRLEELFIRAHKYKIYSLNNLPAHLPNIKKICIDGVVTLSGFPQNIPLLKHIELHGCFANCKGLPKNLVQLETLGLYSSELRIIKHLPQYLPNLHRSGTGLKTNLIKNYHFYRAYRFGSNDIYVRARSHNTSLLGHSLKKINFEKIKYYCQLAKYYRRCYSCNKRMILLKYQDVIRRSGCIVIFRLCFLCAEKEDKIDLF